jgi:hypothetical protein
VTVERPKEERKLLFNHQQQKCPLNTSDQPLSTLEELEERTKVKQEMLAREAEGKRRAEGEGKCTEEEAAKKAAEAKVVRAAAKKWKAMDDKEVVVGPSKMLKEKARVTSMEHEPELAESPCQR